MIEFDTSELNALAATLDDARVRIGKDMSQILRRAAKDVQSDARALAPVRTGALRASIEVEIHGTGNRTEMEAEIGPTVFYARFVEYGTSHSAPEPFMGPALDRNVGGLVDSIEFAAENDVFG